MLNLPSRTPIKLLVIKVKLILWDSRNEAGTNHPGRVVVIQGGSVECFRAAVASDIEHVVVVAEIAGRIAPGSNRAALAIDTGLRAERGVVGELRSTIVGVEQEREVVVPYVATGSVYRLERVAAAITKAGDNNPAGLLLEGGGTGRRDDLSVDGGAGVSDIVCRAAVRGSPQRDRGPDGKGRAADQRRDGVAGSYDVGLHQVVGSVGRIARGHHALVEGALGAITVVAADAENDGALFAHRVIASWAHAAVVRR